MPHPRRRTLASLVVTLAALSAAAQPPTAPTGDSGRQDTGRPNIWWNAPRFITALSLSETQRAALDQLLDRQMTTRREHAQRYREVRRRLAEQLEAGEWQGVAATREELAAATAELSRDDSDLMLAVVRELTPEQRQKLTATFPLLLYRPWLRTFGGPMGGAGAAGGVLRGRGGAGRDSGSGG